MDRIDKCLLILPLLPVADLLSTLFSIPFGGEEFGILARPILLSYGPQGLVILSASASIFFLFFMMIVINIKNLFIKEWKFKWMWYILAIQIYWFFMLEAGYFSTVIMNFLVPFVPALTQTLFMRVVFALTYFALINALNTSYVKKISRL